MPIFQSATKLKDYKYILDIAAGQTVENWITYGARPANVPADAALWAAGNEPFWAFVLRPDVAEFRTPEATLALPATALRRGDGTVAYDVVHDGQRIRVELSPGLCSDTMSEAAFGRRALVALAGRLYTGCGLVR